MEIIFVLFIGLIMQAWINGEFEKDHDY